MIDELNLPEEQGKITIKGYGWKPDLPDFRDKMYKAPRFTGLLPLPASVDLREFAPPVYDQGNLGSCTANALGAAYQMVQKKMGKFSKMPSRLFIYYNERILERTVNIDSGATLRNGIKTMSLQGVAPEEHWPYDIAKFTKRPTVKAYSTGRNYTVSSYARLDNSSLKQLKSCLVEGYPFVFGFSVYNSFENGDVALTGIMKMPATDERNIGGHAVMAVGYDDAKQAFLIRNSWGSKWGQKGYFWMPYEYITNKSLAMDFWTIRLVTN